MCRVERLDVCTHVRSPIVNHRGRATATPGLVAKLPREDGGRVFVAVDDESNPIFVGCLGLGVRVKRGSRASESGGIAIDASRVVPVVEQRENDLDIVLFSHLDGRVKAGNT